MKWISVKDSLPPKLAPGQYETYLISDTNYVKEAHWLWKGKFCTAMDGCSDVTPTHWRPRPDPPHPIDKPVDYSQLPRSDSSMSPGVLTLDGGFLGEIEIHYSIMPAEPQNDAKEDIDISEVLINGHAISQLSQEYWLDAFVHYEPKGYKAEMYSIEEIIVFMIKKGS